jgi:type III secretory pathway component EscT
MKKLRNIVLILGVAIGIGLFIPVSANAVSNVISDQCAGVTDSTVCNKANSTTATPSNFIGTIVNTLLFIVGALSVVMIILGGIFYATSNGDSSRVTLAKNTITYAIIGLVVSFLAFAVVNFVVIKFTKS